MNVLLILSLMLNASAAQTDPTGSWQSKGSGPYWFASSGSASNGTYLYYVGSSMAFAPSCYRYDPVTDSWAGFPDPQLPPDSYGLLSDNCCAVVGGTLYSFGDYSELGAIFSYDLAQGLTGSWTRLAVTVTNGHRAACATDGERVYIVGGYRSGVLSALSIFDPTGPSVIQGAPMPEGRMEPSAAFLPSTGKLYVMGGGTTWAYGGGLRSTCWEYDPGTNAWASRAGFATLGARSGAGTLVLRNRIYLVGGWPAATNRQTIEYSPGADAWTRRADTILARQGGGGEVASGKGYIYGGMGGGSTTGYSLEEFSPPDFGLPPNAAADVVQAGANGTLVQAGLTGAEDPLAWTTDRIDFTAQCSDPDAGQQVRFEVQIKPSGAASWVGAPIVSTALSDQGTLSVHYDLPAEGDYDWRYRVADALDNFTPSDPNGGPDWTEFGVPGVSPDFRSDQSAPSAVTLISPVNGNDVLVPDPIAGPVTFSWTAAADNGPPSLITYELQVARDSSFGEIIHTASGIPAEPRHFAAVIPVSRFSSYWRVRARDLAGLDGPWSPTGEFRAVHDDGRNHGAGDAQRVCGFGAGALPGSGLLVLAALIGAAALARRK